MRAGVSLRQGGAAQDMKQTDELKQTTDEMEQAALQPAAEKPAEEVKPNPDDLPVYLYKQGNNFEAQRFFGSHLTEQGGEKGVMFRDRKSTRLNSSHVSIS